MKIEQIRLKNYRNHTNTVIDLGHVNVFTGKNRSGKTSILTAIETVLTGRNEWSEIGRIQDCIQHGEKKSEVTVVGKNPVTRVILKNHTELKMESTSITQDVLLSSLKVDAQVVKAVSRTDKFLQLTNGEQQKLLFGLFGGTYSTEEFFKMINEWMKKKKLKLNVEDFLLSKGKPISGSQNLSDMLNQLYEIAVGERRVIRREMERLNKIISSLEPTIDMDTPKRFSPTQMKELSELESRRDKLHEEIGAQNANDKLIVETKIRV